jgi:hypothetical protein
MQLPIHLGPSYVSLLNTVSVSESPGVQGARSIDYDPVRRVNLRSLGGDGAAGRASPLTFRFEETHRVRRLATGMGPLWPGTAGHSVGKWRGD